MKRTLLLAAILLIPMISPLRGGMGIPVVTTTEDLASIARSVGGDRVSVTSLARGNADLHYLQARPDFIVILSKAKLFVQIGLGLEAGWVPPLLQQSRNRKIQKGNQGHCVPHRGIPLLDRSTGTVSRRMGDVHPEGNPHYWTDPVNAIVIGKNIRDSLIAIDPPGKKTYGENFNRFRREMTRLAKNLVAVTKPFRGKKVAVYHTEYSYLLKRCGLKQGVTIEELPGVPPSAAHIRRVVSQMMREKISLILATPWSDLRHVNTVARRSGAKILILPIQTGSTKKIPTYEAMVREVTRMLKENL